ncbi:Kinesin-Like Protein Kif3C [Manis pentadactyla]|nr:Kinesin-Like Protein Kif3C [Manis pentadactyla]
MSSRAAGKTTGTWDDPLKRGLLPWHLHVHSGPHLLPHSDRQWLQWLVLLAFGVITWPSLNQLPWLRCSLSA